MSKVEGEGGGGVGKASCNYIFFEASTFRDN